MQQLPKFCKDLEQTLIIIKPHAVKRGLVGKVLTKFEDRGLKLLLMNMMHGDHNILSKHYEDHTQSKYFDLIVKEMQDGPLVAAV